MTDTVELTLPVEADLVALARFAAATIASRANFDVEEIEDLRLAVDELCVSVLDGATDGRLELRFLRDGGQVEVACVFVPSAVDHPDGSGVEYRNDLSDRIVDALVDEHGQDTQGGHPRAWLRKRRASRSA
jgi:serine/threonine-protein kinase RsbW